MKLTDVRGIGPKTEQLFEKLGIRTTGELIRHYPVGYETYAEPVSAANASPGAKCAVRGTVIKSPVLRRTGKGTVTAAEISDGTGKIRAVWFNSPFISGMLKKGSEWVFRGMILGKGETLTMQHPEVLEPERYAGLEKSLVPVYSLTRGLTSRKIGKYVGEALREDSHESDEYLPEDILKDWKLTGEADALRQIHFPKDEAEFDRARRRLVFDEFFLFITAFRSAKNETFSSEDRYPMKGTGAAERILASLPYTLTGAQKRVWGEVRTDLTKKGLMNRLVQGDVGSGKTVIAFLALVTAAENGYQSAMMAPTEVLAEQHYRKFCSLKEKCGLEFLHPVLLSGELPASEKKSVRREIATGGANVVIGTHALIEEDQEYPHLALVITDEQHRFGVRQRDRLREKGGAPNILVMSATPIPRTLGVVCFGDFDISVIDERPSRRLPVKNAVIDESFREAAVRFIGRIVRKGEQVYIICPMIESDGESPLADVESEAAAIRKALPDVRVGILHGRMKGAEKNEAMREFAEGRTDVLVSTTVIEVGVDVPNATVMMIENAERFGLAQLHQLRGRVGRGTAQSYCIFMEGQKSPDADRRLGILKNSDNGFEIAEKDLELRGPGDLMGLRQSGAAMFRIADVARDSEILKEAGEASLRILRADPGLRDGKYRNLNQALKCYTMANERNITL